MSNKKATLSEYSNKIASFRKGNFSHFPYQPLPGKTGFLAVRYKARGTEPERTFVREDAVQFRATKQMPLKHSFTIQGRICPEQNRYPWQYPPPQSYPNPAAALAKSRSLYQSTP